MSLELLEMGRPWWPSPELHHQIETGTGPPPPSSPMGPQSVTMPDITILMHVTSNISHEQMMMYGMVENFYLSHCYQHGEISTEMALLLMGWYGLVIVIGIMRIMHTPLERTLGSDCQQSNSHG